MLLRNQLIDLLKKREFELRKWASNAPNLLVDLPESHLLTNPNAIHAPDKSATRILGLQWNYNCDVFSFQVAAERLHCTKRTLLSMVAKIYDPLGFLAPVTLFLKHLIQLLWKLDLDWDDNPPANIISLWNRFTSELPSLSTVQIPRQAFFATVNFQIHAFCDASQRGYAAVVYLRCIIDNQPVVRLLIAKSKVAPLNNKRIPRLELCGAVLLARLVKFCVDTFCSSAQSPSIFAWTDSSIVLYWLASPAFRWGTFVSNRVAFIHETLPFVHWRHVSGTENPADAPSRGLFPDELVAHPLWWSGPAFLNTLDESWNDPLGSINRPDNVDLEEPKLTLVNQTTLSGLLSTLLTRFSSLQKILRIVAYTLRFIHNARTPHEKRNGCLSELELHDSLLVIVKEIQSSVFAYDIDRVSKNKMPSSQLRRLSPFLDSVGIIRVGGRLRHANLPFETKHPALLPQHHILSDLIITYIHERHCHPGINATMHLIRQNFWILSCRRAVSRRLKSCIECFRQNPVPYSPVMGNLPAVRLSQIKPFQNTGVDFAGPFQVTILRKRGVRTYKCYLCLFVCFSVKAVHLEIVTDLTVGAFLAGLRRFIARRGRCARLFSDCGTNFVGADNELVRYMELAAQEESIRWSFNPPSAPHFGGLWESSVKSFKTHFYRVVGKQILSFEEFNTLAVQIEAVLNSRPLCDVSADPNDLTPLTPGHFLTLQPLTAPPDPDLSHVKPSTLSRWQLIQSMHQQFWQRWQAEYFHNLYQKSKWFQSKNMQNSDIGSLVLIKDENVPPLKWRLGRILELHPGDDGIPRVATVRTLQGTFKRPMVKLCPLPVHEPAE